MGDRRSAPYTNVPVGAGGTANYPSSQKVSGTTGTAASYPASQNGYGVGKDVNMQQQQKAGYGNEYTNGLPQEKSGYGSGGGYVQQTPVTYGPDGRPIVKKNHRLRNAVIGVLAVCCCCIAL